MGYSTWSAMGRLTKDPELKRTESGKAVMNFSLAVERPRSKKTDFIPCIAWEKIAENLKQFCIKGTKLIVEGYPQTSSYTDKNGSNRNIVEMCISGFHFCESKSKTATEFSDLDDSTELPF